MTPVEILIYVGSSLVGAILGTYIGRFIFERTKRNGNE